MDSTWMHAVHYRFSRLRHFEGLPTTQFESSSCFLNEDNGVLCEYKWQL